MKTTLQSLESPYIFFHIIPILRLPVVIPLLPLPVFTSEPIVINTILWCCNSVNV